VPHFADFKRDRSLLGGYRVDWRDRTERVAAHNSFIASWVLRDSFRAKYPESLSAVEFVNQLFDSANLKPYARSEKP